MEGYPRSVSIATIRWTKRVNSRLHQDWRVQCKQKDNTRTYRMQYAPCEQRKDDEGIDVVLARPGMIEDTSDK
jgi:hypothetical protein